MTKEKLKCSHHAAVHVHEQLMLDDPAYRAHWEQMSAKFLSLLADAELDEFDV